MEDLSQTLSTAPYNTLSYIHEHIANLELFWKLIGEREKAAEEGEQLTTFIVHGRYVLCANGEFGFCKPISLVEDVITEQMLRKPLGNVDTNISFPKEDDYSCVTGFGWGVQNAHDFVYTKNRFNMADCYRKAEYRKVMFERTKASFEKAFHKAGFNNIMLHETKNIYSDALTNGPCFRVGTEIGMVNLYWSKSYIVCSFHDSILVDLYRAFDGKEGVELITSKSFKAVSMDRLAVYLKIARAYIVSLPNALVGA